MSNREWLLWWLLVLNFWYVLYTVSPTLFWAVLVFSCSLAAGVAFVSVCRRWTRR